MLPDSALLDSPSAPAHGQLYSSLAELNLASTRSPTSSVNGHESPIPSGQPDDCHAITVDPDVCNRREATVRLSVQTEADIVRKLCLQNVILSAHCGYIYALESVEIQGRRLLISGCRLYGPACLGRHMWRGTRLILHASWRRGRKSERTPKRPRFNESVLTDRELSGQVWDRVEDGFVFESILLEEQADAVLALKARNDGTLLVGLQGGAIRVFDLLTSATIRTVATGTSDVMSISLFGAGFVAALASGDLQVRASCLRICIACTSAQKPPQTHSAHLTSRCQFWSQAFLLESVVQAHKSIALCCLGTHDATSVLSGGNDGSLRLWQAKKPTGPSPLRSEALQGERHQSLRSSDQACCHCTLKTLTAAA